MASIQCRTSRAGEKTYTVKVRLKGHPLQAATFHSLTKARQWAAATESAIREGRHFKTSEAKRHTLADLIDRYKVDVLPRKRNAVRQGQQLDWWREQIGAYALADCTPALIGEYRDKLANTPIEPRGKARKNPPAKLRSGASVNRYLAALSHCFTIAVKEYGWVEDNPCFKVTRKKESAGRDRFLSDDERARLLAACKASTNPHLHDAVLLALNTGGREMEVLGLRWSDVDLKAGTVVFRQTKNSETRAVPVRGAALAMLKQRAKLRRLDTDLLFPGRTKPDQKAKPVEFRRSWETALKRARIENFRWHDLRHTAGSYMAQAGFSPVQIAEYLGHKTLAMVRRYSHFNRDHLIDIAATLAARLDGHSGD